MRSRFTCHRIEGSESSSHWMTAFFGFAMSALAVPIFDGSSFDREWLAWPRGRASQRCANVCTTFLRSGRLVTTTLPTRGSILRYARIGGFLYLMIIILGGFAELFARAKLIVPADPAATANNILASEWLWRSAFSAEYVMLVCDVGVAVILYVLLEPVDRYTALLAAFFRLMHVAIYGVTGLTTMAALNLIRLSGSSDALDPSQLQALAYQSLKLHGDGYAAALVFFGVHCLLIGYLLFRSSYLPKTLGVLMAIAGLSYLTDSFAGFLAPSLEAVLFPGILVPAFIAEASLTFWLIFKGLDFERWAERLKAQI